MYTLSNISKYFKFYHNAKANFMTTKGAQQAMFSIKFSYELTRKAKRNNQQTHFTLHNE